MDKLELVFQVSAAGWKPQWQPRVFTPQSFCNAPFPAGTAAQHTKLIILDRCPGINMGSQYVSLAFAQTLGARLHRLIGFLLVESIGKTLGIQRGIFRHWLFQLRAVNRCAAGEDKLL